MIRNTLRLTKTTDEHPASWLGTTWTVEALHPESVTFQVRKGRRKWVRINITRRYLSEMLTAGELTRN